MSRLGMIKTEELPPIGGDEIDRTTECNAGSRENDVSGKSGEILIKSVD